MINSKSKASKPDKDNSKVDDFNDGREGVGETALTGGVVVAVLL
jgi:hypothetical protein